MEIREVEWLPSAEMTVARARAAAAADMLLSPDTDLRQYWCDNKRPDGGMMAHHENAGGSCFFLLSVGKSCAAKAIVIPYSLAPDALARLQSSPDLAISPLARQLLAKDEFRPNELSFLAWSEDGGPWQGLFFTVEGHTSFDLGRDFLDVIAVGPKAFYLYAKNYHEVTLDPPALKSVFLMTPMDEALVKAIAPDTKLVEVRVELGNIGYPLAAAR